MTDLSKLLTLLGIILVVVLSFNIDLFGVVRSIPSSVFWIALICFIFWRGGCCGRRCRRSAT